MTKFILTLFRLKNFLYDKLPKDSFLYEILLLLPRKIIMDSEIKNAVQAEIDEYLSTGKVGLFETIELETINRCNGECAFCPVNRKDDKRKFKIMDEDLFKNIVNQLRDMDYDGRIQIFSNNEPLLDKRICQFAKYIKETCKKAHLSIFTNGILLNNEKFCELVKYCDTFCIDMYYEGEKKLPDNIKKIVEICIANPVLRRKVIIQMINKNEIRNNRGGQSKNRHFTYKLKTNCRLPFKQVIVRPDGKLSLCCNDALGVYTLGDLTRQTLLEAWYGDDYKNIRDTLAKGGRSSVSLCKYCDNFGGFGQNESKNHVFTPAQFSSKWEQVDKLLK